MDPISNVDAIVLLLRQRLTERARAERGGRAEAGRSERQTAPAVRQDPLQALAAVEGLDDRTLGRALVQTVMAEHFGARMVNEPQFQQVVDQVSETLRADPATAKLLQRILGELRSSGAR